MNSVLPRTLGIAILAIALFFVGFSIGRHEPAVAQPQPSVRPSASSIPYDSVPTGFTVRGQQNRSALGQHEAPAMCGGCTFQIDIATGKPGTLIEKPCPPSNVCSEYFDTNGQAGASDTSTSVKPNTPVSVTVIISHPSRIAKPSSPRPHA
jgi:hypothetical protein